METFFAGCARDVFCVWVCLDPVLLACSAAVVFWCYSVRLFPKVFFARVARDVVNFGFLFLLPGGAPCLVAEPVTKRVFVAHAGAGKMLFLAAIRAADGYCLFLEGETASDVTEVVSVVGYARRDQFQFVAAKCADRCYAARVACAAAEVSFGMFVFGFVKVFSAYAYDIRRAVNVTFCGALTGLCRRGSFLAHWLIL